MQDRWFKAGLVAICLAMSLGWSTPVLATTYEIYPDSSCTLTDAVHAISTQSAQGSCAAGSGGDIIKLASCQTDNTKALEHNLQYCVDPDTRLSLPPSNAAVYAISSPLVFGGVQTLDSSNQPVDINTSATIELVRANSFDKAIYPNAIIRVVAVPPAACTQRAIFVRAKNALTLKSITLDAAGCDVSTQPDAPNPAPVMAPALPATPTSPNGGVVYSQGNVFLTEGSKIVNGTAIDGGGIYLDAATATGSLGLTLTNALINDNSATGNGGGVGTTSTGTVVITGNQFNIFGNTAAKGGGIYLNGTKGVLGLVSGTLQGNAAAEGAAIDLQVGAAANGSRGSLLNNVTVFGNTGSAALHYGDLCQHADTNAPPACDLLAPPGAATDPNDVLNTWVPDPDKRADLLYNSAVVGNAGGCSFSVSGTPAEYLENAYSVTGAGSGCPAAEQMLVPGNDGGAADNAGVGVLTGADTSNPLQAAATACATTGCVPIDFGRLHYHLMGFMPTQDGNFPALVNAGSPDTATGAWVCSSKDGRGNGRADRCDVGAVELAIAAGATDDIDGVTTAQPTWLDVVKNDLGDVGINCALPPLEVPPEVCLSFPLLPQNGQVEVVYAKGPLPDKTDGTQVFSSTDPNADANDPAYVLAVGAAADATHTYPLVRYTSAAGFHGQGVFMYEVAKSALKGATLADVPPRAQVNLTVAPKDDFQSKDISDFKSGGVGGWMLLSLLLLGFVRKTRVQVSGKRQKTLQPRWLLLFLLTSAGLAQADITVNSLADPTNLAAAANDGQCTLREALQRSFDVSPEPNGDCDAGAPGTDTILLPEGTITLTSALNIPVSNSVVLEGAGVDKTIIDGANQFRINTQSALTLKYLTFQHGFATQGGAVFTTSDLGLDHVALVDNVATVSGGAVYLSYGSDVKHSLGMDRSYLARNQAPNGGAIYTVGQTQQLAISVTNSTFDSNAATNGGGAIDANLAKGGSLDVINSIFTANTSTIGGTAIDLASANPSTTANLLNNTFYNNDGLFLDIGNNNNVVLSNSIVAGAGLECRAATSTGALKGDYYNLYTPAEPASCGTAGNNVMTAPLADVTTALGALLQTNAPCNLNDPDADVAAACKLTVTSDYLPPLFKLVALPPADPAVTDPNEPGLIILDRGNPTAASSGTISPATCRTVDMRGKSRQAGKRYGTDTHGRCDLGAFEVQIISALDDTTTTLTSRNDGVALTERQGRADVLTNDLPEDGAKIETSKVGFHRAAGNFTAPADGDSLLVQDITAGNFIYGAITLPLPAVTPAGVYASLKWVKVEQGDPLCVAGDECGLVFSQSCDDLAASIGMADCAALKTAINHDVDNGLAPTDPGAQINSTTDPNNLVCPDSNTPAIKLPYVTFDTNGNIGTAFLSVTLTDVPPQFSKGNITVYTKPDEAVSFALNAVDPDGVIKSVSIPDNGDPMFAAEDPVLAQQKHDTGDVSIHPAWGVGVKWNDDRDNPMITYTRGNKSQEFNDSFRIQVTDNCDKTSVVSVSVKFPQHDGEGNGLLTSGSLGWGLVLLFGLGLVRRRRILH